MMTPRENLIRTVRWQNPQWVPFDFGISKGGMAMFRQHLGANINVAEHYKFDGRWIGPSVRTRRPTPDWRKLYYADGSLPAGAQINPEWGDAKLEYPDTDDADGFYPLRNLESEADFDAYPWPDDSGAAHRYNGMKERVQAAQVAGYPVYASGLNFFEHLWGLTGFEKMLMGMAANEPWARKMFWRHAEDLVRAAEQIALTGADILQTGSDVATQLAPLIAPQMWREWIFPLMRDSITAARRIKPDIVVFYHSDGNVEALIEGFIEAGVDILDPIQPECMDIFALKAKYGDRIAFHGGIGVQTVMPFGSPQEVKDTVRRTIDGMSKGGGGYICATAHMIRPEVPWANVLALVETVRSYGHP